MALTASVLSTRAHVGEPAFEELRHGTGILRFGDEFDTLVANPQYNTYVLIRDIIADWGRAYSPFTAPDPAVEGRITALGTPPP